jgi:outer membrane protein TolC
MFAVVAAADEPGSPASALERLSEVQRGAATASPALSARLQDAASLGAEARAEAAAVNPYVEWQSEGLGSERKPNAQDTLRLSTPFNFLGQIGPARELVDVADEASLQLRAALRRSVAVEASRRWLELAAVQERVAVRRARLERLERARKVLEARHRLGEVAGIEVTQLDIESINVATQLETSAGELEGLTEAVHQLCGSGFPVPRNGDLEELTRHSSNPPATRLESSMLAAGTPIKIANAQAGIEQARAQMASATAWGRPLIEAEWEHFPALQGVESYDAWGFRLSVPLPLGSVGKRQRAAARERSASAEAVREAALEDALRSARAALALAEAAEARLRTLEPVMADLDRIEKALSAQYRLGAITYLEYVYGTTRHDDLLLAAIDARLALALARLELGHLLDDPDVFPMVAIPTEETS